MKVALINSRDDLAGCNIRHHIKQCLSEARPPNKCQERSYDFFDVGGRLIHAAGVDAGIDADLIIFLSRHSSVNPVPVLTVHATGNFGAAELGGSPRTLAPAAPAMMQATLRALTHHCPEGYRVSYEVTHHGPTELCHPSFFVEIGSTEKEWVDPVAGRAVAEAVLSAAPVNAIPLIGIGGTHYAPRETSIALSTRGAFGHIASSLRQVTILDKEMVQAMIVQSSAIAAYIDRKSLSSTDLERLTTILESLKIPRLFESEIVALDNLSWDTYYAVRDLAANVSLGARCVVHALSGNGSLTVISPDPALFAETKRCDEPAFIRGLEALPIVHLTNENNVLLPHFVGFSKDSSELINALNTLCVKIIRNRENTATENDCLVIRKNRFDPAKARKLGVPAGPTYRQLAAGQAVELDGRVITPDQVSVVSETRIHIPGLENYS
jgi:D-aminoacyl-tRNA deacylase